MKWLISWILSMSRSLTTTLRLRLTCIIHMPTLRLDIATRYEYSYSSKICVIVFSSKEDWRWKRNRHMSTTLRNNCVAFIFDEIRYELSVEIDLNRKCRNYHQELRVDDVRQSFDCARWNSRSDMEEGHFNFCMPLNMLLGFCENCKRVINARRKLILYEHATITIVWWEILRQRYRLNYSKCSGKCLTLR